MLINRLRQLRRTARRVARGAALRCVDVSYLFRGIYRPSRNIQGLSLERPAIPLKRFSPSKYTIIHTPDFLPDPLSSSGEPFESSAHVEFARQYLTKPDFDFKETRYYKLAVRGRLPVLRRGLQQTERRCRQYIYLINRLKIEGYLPDKYGPISVIECTDGAIMVLNGKHRLAALLALGVEDFPVAFCFENEVYSRLKDSLDRSWPAHFYRKSRHALDRIGKPSRRDQSKVQELLTAIKRNHLANLGEVYHPIPFREFRSLTTQVHDKTSYSRLGMILSQYPDLHNKRVLDLGCNVGFYSFSLAKRGARVTGLDSSEQDIKLARELARIYEVPVDFQNRPVTPEFWQENGVRYDIVLCFSMLQWVIAQSGQRDGRQLLKTVSERSEALFFDVPVNRGKACLTCRAGQELAFVYDLLHDATAFRELVHVGDVHPYGTDTRHVFLAHH